LKALLGTKLGMIQITKDNGEVVPITLIQAGPCYVTQIKNDQTDGYNAVQVSYGDAKLGKSVMGKSVIGHLKKSKVSASALREFRVDSTDLEIGAKLTVNNFEVGDRVKVSGLSKGKGFAGTVKRHNFHTGPESHGSKNVRRPGSIGSMFPQKVFKGKKMAGRHGAIKVTTNGVEIAFIDEDKHLIGIKGSVPGARRTLISIRGDK
jgi:large subunit ribosomal protein L3